MGKPSYQKNWGWCRETCSKTYKQHIIEVKAKALQETKVDLLTEEQCEEMGSNLGANGTLETCAGRKNHFPKILKFVRVKSVVNNTFYFKPKGPSYNYLGFKETKYNFYLGGTDSCQGTKLLLMIVPTGATSTTPVAPIFSDITEVTPKISSCYLPTL